MTASNTARPPHEGTNSTHAAAEEQAQFASAFSGMAASVARPMFERLARHAARRGFAATVREDVDEHNNPRLALSFIPEPGSRFGMAPAQECVFALKGLVAEKAVEYAACHDQREGKNGIRITKSDLQSINGRFLETCLDDFLVRALEARHAG